MPVNGPRGRSNFNGRVWNHRGSRGGASPMRGIKRPLQGEDQQNFNRPPPFAGPPPTNAPPPMQNMMQPPPVKKRVLDRLGVRESGLGAHVTGIPEERHLPNPHLQPVPQQQFGNPQQQFAKNRPDNFPDASLRLGERIGHRLEPPHHHGEIFNHGPPVNHNDGFHPPHGGPPARADFDYGHSDLNNQRAMQQHPPPNNDERNWNPTRNGGPGVQQQFPRGSPMSNVQSPLNKNFSPSASPNLRGNMRGSGARMGHPGGAAGARAGGPWQGNTRGGQRGFPSRGGQRGLSSRGIQRGQPRGNMRGNRNNSKSNYTSKSGAGANSTDTQKENEAAGCSSTEEGSKLGIPKEALYCSICDYAKFESESEYEKHLKNIYHTGAVDIYKTRYIQFLELMKISAQLSDRQRDNKYAISKVKPDQKTKVTTAERKIYEELLGKKVCCDKNLTTIQHVIDHIHSIEHLKNDFDECNKRAMVHNKREKDNQEKTIEVLQKIAESDMLMLENLPAYDEKNVCGLQFLVKEDRFFCTVCERAFPTTYAEDHCRTFAHYEKLLMQLKKEKTLRETLCEDVVDEIKQEGDESTTNVEVNEKIESGEKKEIKLGGKIEKESQVTRLFNTLE